MATFTHSIFYSIILFPALCRDEHAVVIGAKVPVQAVFNASAMTNQEVEDLISRINFLRTLSLPTASKMNCLEWNSTLAQKALTLAQSCITNSMESSLNIAFKTTKSQDFYIVLEDYWFAELYRIEGKTCDSDEPRNCKNWKALMNANNNFVGCNRAPCSGNQYLYVCVFDYIPRGESFVPYQIGNPCSKCSLPKTVCKDNSLCCSPNAETTETAKPNSQSGETTQKDCLFDWQCKWNEKCPATKRCQVDGNTNHQENVRCYVDSHCHSQYVCNEYTGTCNFKGRMFEHTTDKEGEKGACTDDTECPNGYHCNMHRYTCYKESPRMITADGEDEPAICPSSPAYSCTFDYHCCHNEVCNDGKCGPRLDESERHLKFVTCLYSYHCPSEYVCTSETYTCYYAGKTHSHLPYGVFRNGIQIFCYADKDCPENYYCMKYSFTCYEKGDFKMMRLDRDAERKKSK